MRMILTGVLFVIGGLSGTFVLRGTGSSALLAVVGVVLIFLGAVSAARGADGLTATPSDADRERDEEQWAEYQRVRAEQAAQQAAAEAEAARQQAQAHEREGRRERLQALLMTTPGAKKQIDLLLERTGPYLSPDEQLDVALDTARRLQQAHAARA